MISKYRTRYRKALISIRVTVTVLAGMMLVSTAALNVVRQHNLKIGSDSVAKAREAGLPLNLAELQAWANKRADCPPCGAAFQEAFKIEIDDDQARFLAALLKVPITFRIMDGVDYRELDAPTLRTAADELLSSSRTAVARLRKALDESSPCYFTFANVDDTSAWPKFATEPEGRGNEYLRQIKYLAHLLVLSGYTEIDLGNLRSSSESVVYLLKLARMLRDEPLFESQYLREELLRSACHLLEATMNEGEVDPAISSSIVALCEEQEGGSPMYLASVGAFAESMPAFTPAHWKERETFHRWMWVKRYARQARGHVSQNPEFFWKVFTAAYDGLGLWSLDQRAYVEKSFIALNQIAPENIGEVYLTIEYSAEWDRSYCVYSRDYEDYFLLHPPIDRAPEELSKEHRNRDGRTTAPTRLVRIALALEAYRRAKGGYPVSLDELVPDFLVKIPLDPFDGSPLRYSLRADRWVLHSIWLDAIDSGGSGAVTQWGLRVGDSEESMSVEDLAFSVSRRD